MLSSKNLLKPADGSVIVNPSQDMVLGIYFLTNINDQASTTVYTSTNEAIYAYEISRIKLQDPIKVELGEE